MSASRKFFIGVVPEGLEENSGLKVLLGKMKRTLRDREKEARWSSPDLWHVTLQFFGALSDEELSAAKSALASWHPASEAVQLEVGGVGAFPEPHEARILWLGVQRSQELLSFRQSLVSHMNSAGVSGSAAEEESRRDFVPHLTIARLRNLQSVDDLIRLGGRKSIGEYPIREVILFESVLQGNMKKYVPIERRLLGSSQE